MLRAISSRPTIDARRHLRAACVRVPAGLFIVVMLGACPNKSDSGGKAATAKVEKKTLVFGSNSEPDVLSPLFSEMAAAREIIFLMSRELTMHNDKWELVPDLAEEVPSIDNGLVKLLPTGELDAEGNAKLSMEVTWHLKKDAFWEDGTPVTADDYIFAWEVQTDPTQEVINRDVVERVAKMEARGDDHKTLIVTWKEPFAFYHQFRVHYALPKHALAARYHRPGGGTNDMKRDPYSQRPLSNGPFRFVEWKAGQYVTLTRNERYQPKALINDVTFRFIGDDRTMESALIAGDLDAVTPMGGFSVSQIEEMRKSQGDRFRYYSVPGLVWAHIDFNLDAPELQDVRVRQAIAHAIDRQGLIDALFYGRYTLSHTFLPPRHWGYHSSVRTYPYDPAKARALLDAAGFVAEDGETRRKGKLKLALKISAVSGVKDILDLEQVMQQNLKAVGIELIIDNKSSKAFFGEYGRYRKFPHLSFYSWVMDPTLWGNTMWQDDMIPSAENSWKGQNYPGWKNAEVTKLLRDVPVVLDEDKRREMMHKVQEIWAEELPALPMYFRPVVGVTTAAVKGYRPTGTRTPVSWNAHLWDKVAQPKTAP